MSCHRLEKIETRIEKIKKVFEESNKEIIISPGDKYNKEKFFQYLYPKIEFERLNFEGDDYLLNKERKIIICSYFSNTTLKLNGLKFLYHIIKSLLKSS